MINFQPFKGRTVRDGQRVEVYRNLHNGLISIRDTKSKLVLGHCTGVQLTNALFKVSQKGRERVLREQRKNVHAFVKGRLELTLDAFPANQEVTYNPYKYETFVNRDTEQRFIYSDKVNIFSSGKIFTV